MPVRLAELQVSRELGLKLLLLCSTDDEKVRNTWTSCGFEYTADEDIKRWNVCQGDLIYMTNTVQMHKLLPPKRKFQPVSIVHGAFAQRFYAPVDAPRGFAMQMVHEHEAKEARKKQAPSKGVPKGGGGNAQLAPYPRADQAGSMTPPVTAAPSE